mmetsp:Transcript_40151/g.65962  ORF Transcript_40151/g.65962 Transcript_40151/m.65962 type:complete len:88 (+) Transcript_40151:441-704(+)
MTRFNFQGVISSAWDFFLHTEDRFSSLSFLVFTYNKQLTIIQRFFFEISFMMKTLIFDIFVAFFLLICSKPLYFNNNGISSPWIYWL